MVNAVFPILPIVELPSLCFQKILREYQNVKLVKSKCKSEKSKKKQTAKQNNFERN